MHPPIGGGARVLGHQDHDVAAGLADSKIAGGAVIELRVRNLDQPYQLAAQELRGPICGTRVDGQDFEVAVRE